MSAPSHRAQLSTVAIMATVAVGFVVVYLRQSLLPAKFSYDGNRIRGISLGSMPSFGDKEYEGAANIYRTLGLAGHDTTASVVTFCTFVAAILLWRRRANVATNGMPQTVFACVAILLGAVYLGYYSKDVVSTVVVIGLACAPRSKTGEAAIVALMAIYGLTLRTYWVLIACTYVGLRIAWRRWGKRGLISGSLAALLVMCIAINVTQGVSPDHYRTISNIGRIGDPDAQSMLLPLVRGVGFTSGTINVFYALVTLVVPWPLAELGGIYHIADALLFIALWATFGRNVRALGHEESGVAIVRALCFISAFITVQALFEPDYGSALRHLVSVMPAMLAVVGARTPNTPNDRSAAPDTSQTLSPSLP